MTAERHSVSPRAAGLSLRRSSGAGRAGLRLAAGAALLALAACGGGRTEVAFDGVSYNASAARGETVDRFIASARPVSAGLAGAVRAAEHAGKRYCIAQYGSSDIAWRTGPESDPAALPVAGDAVTLEGRCAPW
jgi:hypothetical protein